MGNNTFKGTVGEYIRWQLEYLRGQKNYSKNDKTMSPWFNAHSNGSFGRNTLPMDYYRKTMNGDGTYEFVLISNRFKGFGEKAGNLSAYDISVKKGVQDPVELGIAKKIDEKNPFCKKGHFVQMFTITPEIIDKFVPQTNGWLDKDSPDSTVTLPITMGTENPITGKHSSERQPEAMIAMINKQGAPVGLVYCMYDHDTVEEFVRDILCSRDKNKDACDFFECYNLRGELGHTAADFFASDTEIRAWANSVGLDLDYARTKQESRNYGEFQKEVDEFYEYERSEW